LMLVENSYSNIYACVYASLFLMILHIICLSLANYSNGLDILGLE